VGSWWLPDLRRWEAIPGGGARSGFPGANLLCHRVVFLEGGGRLKLLFISNLFPDTREPYRGLDNATLLHALRARGVEVSTIALRPRLPWQRREWEARAEDAALRSEFVGVPYLPKMGHRWNHRLYARALRGVVARVKRERGCEVVLCSWLFPDACAVARLQGESALPLVAVAQGSDVHQYLKIPARREVMVRELAGASAIVTRSAELGRLLEEAGFPPAKVHPIYNGVDLRRFRPAEGGEHGAARKALGLPAAGPVVLFVGNLLPIKNPGALLVAHARLTATPAFREAWLVIVGGGALEGQLRGEVAGLGTAGQVIFAGRQDADGVARAMRAADVLALSSDNEGVPNVVLEAFASGLPVVATRVGGISEVHRHDFLGKLVPPRDPVALAQALAEVLGRPAETARIAEFGRGFSWEAAAGAYHALLEAALRSRG
jgi:teichuronic acid biosynthesis glycosyltransferase TuaC